MIIITADQVDSTHTADVAGTTFDDLNARYAEQLVLPADRNAGDEIQLLVDDAATALEVILGLLRSERWSVGCGIGGVRRPLATSTRESAGPGFVAARAAVTRAKRAPHRFSLEVDDGGGVAGGDIAPVVDLLLHLRSRRSAEGWELFDLVASGMTQLEAATTLGISPQAASQRAKAAGIRVDLAAQPALVRLIAEANEQH
jgi:hypothetical protein